MPLQVNQNSLSPASATAPDGSAAFPLASSTVAALPSGATALNGASGTVANGTATATLTSAAGRTAYLTGFEIVGTGATSVLVVAPTVTGLVGGTLTYAYVFVAGVTTMNQSLIVEFTTPLQASAANTNIVVSCPASGAGGTNSTVNAHGYLI